MGLFSSNKDNSEESSEKADDESTFLPVACNKNLVLGYYRETAESDPQLKWVSNTVFDRIDVEDIDSIEMPDE